MDLTAGPYLEYPDGTVPMVTKMNTGRMSPVRSRTMKEYDSQITDLKKENFNLKLRIYFMEERMQQRLGDGDDVFKIVRCTTKFPSNMFLIETDGGGKTLEFVKHLFQAFQYS